MKDTNVPITMKSIIKAYKIQLLIITVVLTVILNKGADKALTYFLNINNKSIFTHNYALGKDGVVLIIPAALLSILIIKVFLILKKKF